MQEFDNRPWCGIGGGNSVGLRSLYLGHSMGFMDFHIFGMDSSYENADHVNATPEDQSDIFMTVEVGDKVFKSQPWMVEQVEQFKVQHEFLVSHGCTVKVYGDGLLPYVANSRKQCHNHRDISH